MRSLKIIAIANGLGLAATIAVSYLSNTGVVDGHTMAELSARYPTLVTPAPYAFSIWGLIYLSLIGFVGYYARAAFRGREDPQEGGREDPREGGREDPALRVGGWFLVTCVANCCWVLAWLYGYTGLSVLLMVLLLGVLLRIIVLTDMELTDPLWPGIVFVWWPFCLYTGWITVAILANIAAWLVKLGIGVSALGAIGLLVVAGAVYLFMTWKRNMREYAFVGVWALAAIARADWHRAPAVAGVAAALAAVLFISSSIHGYRNRAYGPFRKR
jgi:hypothetical protein